MATTFPDRREDVKEVGYWLEVAGKIDIHVGSVEEFKEVLYKPMKSVWLCTYQGYFKCTKEEAIAFLGLGEPVQIHSETEPCWNHDYPDTGMLKSWCRHCGHEAQFNRETGKYE